MKNQYITSTTFDPKSPEMTPKTQSPNGKTKEKKHGIWKTNIPDTGKPTGSFEQRVFHSKDAASRVDISIVVGPFEIIEDGVAFIIDPFWESKIVVKGEFAWASGRFFPEERIEYITVKFADQKPFQLTIFLVDDEEDF